jgi:EmrB/QacA subfamily drug resistance transporter
MGFTIGSMEYKWKALSVTSVGSMMAAIDSTIVLLALLPIAEDLRSDFVLMIWVVIAYLLVNTAFVLSLGRIGDMYGRKRMYNTGFVVFTIGSVLCGLSPEAEYLVAFRAVQGFGSALLIANAFAIISEAFEPRERGRAFGIIAVVWGAGSVLGIVLGGIIITFTSWRFIFLINLPIGIFATYWARRTLRRSHRFAEEETFDLAAAVFFTLAVLTLLLGITWGLLNTWTDALTLTFFALCPVFFVVFVAWELRVSRDPIIDFTVFRNRVFTLSVATAALQSLALFSVNFLLVFYLEGIAGVDILTASYLIVPGAVVTAIVGPFGGVISDRFGSRVVATIGLAVQVAALLALSSLTATSTILEVAFIEAFFGLGAGLFWPANTSAIMSSSPPKMYGVASGIMNTLRNTGMVMSFGLTLVAISDVIPRDVLYQLFIGTLEGGLPHNLASEYLSGQKFAFLVSTALLTVAIVLSAIRGKAAHEIRAPAAGRA